MTKTDLIARVLGKLRAIQSGATVGGGDEALVGAKYDEVYQMLDGKGLVTWTATEDIPTAPAIHVITIVAYNCADDYEVAEPRLQRLRFEAEGEGGAIDRLRELSHIPYVSIEDPEYY